MAPEVVRAWPGEETDQPYTEVVDEWSVGMLLFAVVRGESPFLVDRQRGKKTQNNVGQEQAAHDRWQMVACLIPLLGAHRTGLNEIWSSPQIVHATIRDLGIEMTLVSRFLHG